MNAIIVGKSYRVYGKMEGMKRFQMLAGNDFTRSKIKADIFHIDSEDKLKKFKAELKFLNTQGEFEARLIK